jgi:hypothetical protein
MADSLQPSTHRNRTSLLLCACLLAVVIVIAARAGKMLVIDAPERSDVIVVLAGETDRRPQKALALLAQGYAPKVVIDVPANERIYEFSQLDLAKKYIADLPQAASLSVCPTRGLSTKEETHAVEQCLSRDADRRVLIVTSDYHTRRALDVFHHEIPGRTFSVAAARDPIQFEINWWAHRQWAKTFVDEWLRLLWWKAVDRWRSPSLYFSPPTRHGKLSTDKRAH